MLIADLELTDENCSSQSSGFKIQNIEQRSNKSELSDKLSFSSEHFTSGYEETKVCPLKKVK
jgi:hypothetical protein